MLHRNKFKVHRLASPWTTAILAVGLSACATPAWAQRKRATFRYQAAHMKQT